MLRGWLPFYRTSIGLGARSLLRGRFTREAVVRLLAPLEDTRLYELPAAVAALDARPGERVLDLASPKLAAVQLANAGVGVISIDLLEEEVAAWRSVAEHVRGVEFHVGDGRHLPFRDGSFNHAYSISVLEHIGDDGDLDALSELARVVRTGGRIVLTVPYGTQYSEDWRDAPLYGDQTTEVGGRWFFSRTYDDARLARLLSAAPSLRELDRRPVRFGMSPLYRLYYRALPVTAVLSPVLGLTLQVEEAPGGFMFLALERTQ